MHYYIYIYLHFLYTYIDICVYMYDSSKYVWNIPSSIVFTAIKALLGMQTTTSDHALPWVCGFVGSSRIRQPSQ